MNALWRAFQGDIDDVGTTEGISDPGPLVTLLAALYARGRAAHPDLELGERSFGRTLARAVPERTPKDLSALAIADLYLACACAEGTPGAAAVFEAKHGPTIARAVARVLSVPEEREEAAQRARHRLLVGTPASPPKIAQYLGRGPLDRWVSVATLRVAVSHRRAESARRRLREKAANEVVGVDLELVHLKDDVRWRLESAVEEALGRLEGRSRLVLRFYLVSGMSLAAIGQTFGVTQPTVSRWLADAREDVVSGVRAILAERFQIPADDLRSIIRLVASQLDLSISRVLRSA